MSHPENRERSLKPLREYWSESENRERQSEKLKEVWKNNEEFIEKQRLRALATSFIWHQKDFIAPYLVKKIIAEEFPRLGVIFTKQKNKEELTQYEKNYLSAYYKKCNDVYPVGMGIVSQAAAELYYKFLDDEE